MGGTAFVYGTLMAPEVLNLLIKRVPESRAATLKGYARYRVKGQVFPAIIPSMPESKVAGRVSVLHTYSICSEWRQLHHVVLLT
jgi:gamma-glutamylcyclotransferase (GGCT)/AIG2-like uncharacterized protein YtfP